MRALALSLLAAAVLIGQAAPAKPKPIKLPAPKVGAVALDQSLKDRKSDRELTGPALSVEQVGQLLWSAQGKNRPGPRGRTVPSASAKYPLELYVVVSDGSSLPEGVYKYLLEEHSLLKIKDGSPEKLFGKMERMQPWIPKAPAVFIVSGDSSRMARGSDELNELYTFWESGAASQSLGLQVAALGLGSTVVLGVDLKAVHAAAGLPAGERISVIIPVGRIAK